MRLRAVNQLRENIKACLHRRHEEQKSLAFAAKIDPSTLSKFLRGEREIQLANLDDVADFLGLEPYELFHPRISPLTERRLMQRRSGRERREGHDAREVRTLMAEVVAKHPRTAKGRRPEGPVVERTALHQLVEDFERRAAALISQAELRRQAPVPRRARADLPERDRAVGRPDDPKVE